MSFSAFTAKLHAVFGFSQDAAAVELLSLRREQSSGRDFAVEDPEKSGAHGAVSLTYCAVPRGPN